MEFQRFAKASRQAFESQAVCWSLEGLVPLDEEAAFPPDPSYLKDALILFHFGLLFWKLGLGRKLDV